LANQHQQLAGKCIAANPPPDKLLETWAGTAPSGHAASKSRGCTGPFNSDATSQAGAADTTNLLLTTVVSMMAQNMNASMSKNSKRHSTPPSSPIRPSSPLVPSAAEPHLLAFLEAFGHAKKLPEEAIISAFDNLEQARYTPDILHEAGVSAERLQQLTGLAEGDVYALKKFAREWCGKVDSKRSKCHH
jgi:hypothetical protein